MKNMIIFVIAIVILAGNGRADQAEKPDFASMDKKDLVAIVEEQYEEIQRLNKVIEQLVQSAPDEGESKEQSFLIGRVRIIISAPLEGYDEIGNENREFMEVFVPATNKMVCAFVRAEDLVRLNNMDEELTLNKYGIVQVYRDAEDRDMNEDDFNTIAEMFDELFGGELGPLLDIAGDDFNRKLDALDFDAQMKIKKPINIGRMFSMKDARGYGLIMPYELNIEGNDENIFMAAGVSIIRVRNRLLFLYIFATFEDGDSLKWVDKTSEDWCKAILQANIAD